MTIKNSIALTVVTTIFMSGCSMLPYRDNFQCEKGKNSGVCASVSEVYEMSFDMDTLKKKKLNQEESGCESCGDKDVKKENIGKPIGSDSNSSSENQRLKEIVEAMEIQKIQNGRPVVVQSSSSNMDNDTKRNIQKMIVSKMSSQTGASQALKTADTSTAVTVVDCSKGSGDDVIHTLNQDVKVCVYRANIRKEPSCKAKIVRVANKDEVLYAEYEKNGWVKTDDGYIHKSIITQK